MGRLLREWVWWTGRRKLREVGIKAVGGYCAAASDTSS